MIVGAALGGQLVAGTENGLTDPGAATEGRPYKDN